MLWLQSSLLPMQRRPADVVILQHRQDFRIATDGAGGLFSGGLPHTNQLGFFYALVRSSTDRCCPIGCVPNREARAAFPKALASRPLL